MVTASHQHVKHAFLIPNQTTHVMAGSCCAGNSKKMDAGIYSAENAVVAPSVMLQQDDAQHDWQQQAHRAKGFLTDHFQAAGVCSLPFQQGFRQQQSDRAGLRLLLVSMVQQFHIYRNTGHGPHETQHAGTQV